MKSIADSIADVQLGVTPLSEFIQDVPGHLCVIGGKIAGHPTPLANILSYHGDFFVGGFNKVIKVDDQQGLGMLKQRMCGLPIFGEIKLEYTANSMIHTSKYVLMVNTRHPLIFQQMENVFRLAEKYMSEGKRFCFAINFGPAVRDWFKNAVFNGQYGDYVSTGTKFYITNFGKRCNLCVPSRRCFVLAFGCLPFSFPLYAVGFPIYQLYRHLTCNDDVIYMGTEVSRIKGITQAERQAMQYMMQAAYQQGIAAGVANPASNPV